MVSAAWLIPLLTLVNGQIVTHNNGAQSYQSTTFFGRGSSKQAPSPPAELNPVPYTESVVYIEPIELGQPLYQPQPVYQPSIQQSQSLPPTVVYPEPAQPSYKPHSQPFYQPQPVYKPRFNPQYQPQPDYQPRVETPAYSPQAEVHLPLPTPQPFVHSPNLQPFVHSSSPHQSVQSPSTQPFVHSSSPHQSIQSPSPQPFVHSSSSHPSIQSPSPQPFVHSSSSHQSIQSPSPQPFVPSPAPQVYPQVPVVTTPAPRVNNYNANPVNQHLPLRAVTRTVSSVQSSVGPYTPKPVSSFIPEKFLVESRTAPPQSNLLNTYPSTPVESTPRPVSSFIPEKFLVESRTTSPPSNTQNKYPSISTESTFANSAVKNTNFIRVQSTQKVMELPLDVPAEQIVDEALVEVSAQGDKIVRALETLTKNKLVAKLLKSNTNSSDPCSVIPANIDVLARDLITGLTTSRTELIALIAAVQTMKREEKNQGNVLRAAAEAVRAVEPIAPKFSRVFQTDGSCQASLETNIKRLNTVGNVLSTLGRTNIIAKDDATKERLLQGGQASKIIGQVTGKII